MPSRRSWPGLHSQGRRRCEELLRFELAATPQMRIVQLCVVDHSGDAYRANAHIHVQCLLSDRTRSQWVQLNASLADLRSAAHAVLSGHVRIRLHDPQPGDKRKPEAADAEVAAALPTATLTERALGALTARSSCAGAARRAARSASATCRRRVAPRAAVRPHGTRCSLKQWLETARTCPTYRFSLPARTTPPSPGARPRALRPRELDDNVLDAALGENVLMPDAPPPSPPMGKAELAEVPPPPPPPLVEAAAEPPPTRGVEAARSSACTSSCRARRREPRPYLYTSM